MTENLFSVHDEKADSKTFFTIALVGCFVISGLFLATLIVSGRENAAAERIESQTVRSAFAREISSLDDRLRNYAEKIPLPSAAVLPLSVAGPFDNMFVFDRSSILPMAEAGKGTSFGAFAGPLGSLLARMESGDSDGLRGPIDTIGSRPGPLRSGGDIVFAAGGAWLVAAEEYDLAAHASGKPLGIAAFQKVDEQMLARIARAAHTNQLEILDNALTDSSTGVALTVAPGARPVSIAWRPEMPGNVMFTQMGSMLISFSALFVALIVFRSRRITHELVSSEARAKEDAAQDILTGLPNRARFNRILHAEIERVKRGHERGFAILYLDLDRFKEINDTFGHNAGDRLLVAISQRLVGTIRASGRVARLAGDEFAVLQTDVENPRDCALLARRILEAVAEPVDLGETKVYVGVSIGIALCPHDAAEPDEITHCADLALYRAKNEGRNRFCFFEQRMGDELRMRKTVEDDLRLAIDNNQLVMHYQPVMAPDGLRMIGVEALVRWQHPRQGTISPASFITLAEECGLILPLGEWVLRQSLLEVKRWPGLRVAVNVSGIQFRQKDFVQTVQRLLEETGVEASQLELELTESVLLADADQAEDAMIELRAMGIRLALDDFGTGYSSLIYLRRFAFDKIKIDRSFLESMEATGESSIIVHSIVHLGRALGLTVTAEGVETRDQHRFLQALGCHELQGYLFSQPVLPEEIDKLLEMRPPMKSVA